MLLSPLAVVAARDVVAAAGKMTLAIHQNTSSGAGYRKSLEGWSSRRDQVRRDYSGAAGRVPEDRLARGRPPGAHRPGTDAGLVRLWRRGSVGTESESRRGTRESQEAL